MENKEVVIVSAVRTAIGKFGESLKNVSAIELGSTAVMAAMIRINLNYSEVKEVRMGQVLQAGYGQAPARQVAIGAGLPVWVKAATDRKECGSSLESVAIADSRIRAGDADVIVAGGMESMSWAPYLERRNWGRNFGHRELVDSMLHDGLEDAYGEGHPHMGKLADICAKEHRIGRKEQDEFAFASFSRAKRAIESGFFKEEIVPVGIPKKDGFTVFEIDECVRETSLEKLNQLPPVFERDGTITAGNASQLSDGAAALILMTREKAESLGIKPQARILAQSSYSTFPKHFPLAPLTAISIALVKSSIFSTAKIDLFEINEAFGVVPLLAMEELSIPLERVNVNGGAIALGHPLGASGARILTTLLHNLKNQKKRYGLATACIGGGEAVAIVVENLAL